ncbi:MAG: T9SS type A sorting domain-containing protein [Candidatus Kapabacteria bacterium]|nr:T9SS type A sorting domain-containing protein [Candidatus Kapabacteria bacterium]
MFRYLIIFFLSFTLAFSQKEAHIWYFGEGAGLKFDNSSNSPFVLTDGAMIAPEGCCTISDFEGNLLFYTNGETIWNRNHQILKNGDGLSGSIYSTQSVIILPKPSDQSLYYVFTINSEDEKIGLQYSIVDISLDNGNGEVIEKNIPVFTPVAEKINATRHKNGRDFWIITHELYTNRFAAFLLTNNGLEKTPVFSSIGLSYTGNRTINMGSLKISPDGKKIVCGVFSKFTFELFDFNNETGEIYNPITIPTNESLNAYGCEFSPDMKKLYTTSFDSFVRLYQYDLSSGNAQDIINSAVLIADVDAINVLGTLQLGPDNKIYLAINKSLYLGVIEKPNESGLNCGYNPKGVFLNNKLSRLGLPNVIYDYYNPEVPHILVSLPDTSAYVGEIISIPLKLELFNRKKPKGQYSFTSTIVFDSKLLEIKDIKGAFISENRIIDNKRHLTIISDKIELDKSEQVIAEIVGLVLLGSSRENKLEIQDFQLSDDAIIEKKDGSLTLKGVCQFDLNQLIIAYQPTLKMYPIPSNGYINLSLKNFQKGSNHIEIYDTEGRLVFKDNITIFENQTEEVIRKYHLDIGSGVYFIKVGNEDKMIDDLLIIQK